jgi:hypothetical protein
VNPLGFVEVLLLVLLHWRMVLVRRWAVVISCVMSGLFTSFFAVISVGAAIRMGDLSPERGDLYWGLLLFSFAAVFAVSVTTATAFSWRQLRDGF